METLTALQLIELAEKSVMRNEIKLSEIKALNLVATTRFFQILSNISRS